MGVDEYESRDEAVHDLEGKVVKVKCVRMNKGSGDHPEVQVVKLLLSVAAERDYAVMSLDVKHAFPYREIRRNVYIELPRQDSKSGAGE